MSQSPKKNMMASDAPTPSSEHPEPKQEDAPQPKSEPKAEPKPAEPKPAAPKMKAGESKPPEKEAEGGSLPPAAG